MVSFEELYSKYYKDIYYFILKQTGYRDDLAEELTQETFYQALKHWKEFRGESNVSTWLCTIGKRLYLNCLRRQPTLPLEQAPEPRTPDIAEAIADSDRMMDAHRLLHRLQEPFREVFTLRTFGELSHGQIASLFGKSESWARVTYYRARQMLSHMAKEEWNDEG